MRMPDKNIDPINKDMVLPMVRASINMKDSYHLDSLLQKDYDLHKI